MALTKVPPRIHTAYNPQQVEANSPFTIAAVAPQIPTTIEITDNQCDIQGIAEHVMSDNRTYLSAEWGYYDHRVSGIYLLAGTPYGAVNAVRQLYGNPDMVSMAEDGVRLLNSVRNPGNPNAAVFSTYEGYPIEVNLLRNLNTPLVVTKQGVTNETLAIPAAFSDLGDKLAPPVVTIKLQPGEGITDANSAGNDLPATWTIVFISCNPDTGTLCCVAFDQLDGNQLPYTESTQAAIFRSTNNGQDWSRRITFPVKLLSGGIVEHAGSANIWHSAFSAEDNTVYLYTSTDDGLTWRNETVANETVVTPLILGTFMGWGNSGTTPATGNYTQDPVGTVTSVLISDSGVYSRSVRPTNGEYRYYIGYANQSRQYNITRVGVYSGGLSYGYYYDRAPYVSQNIPWPYSRSFCFGTNEVYYRVLTRAVSGGTQNMIEYRSYVGASSATYYDTAFPTRPWLIEPVAFFRTNTKYWVFGNRYSTLGDYRILNADSPTGPYAQVRETTGVIYDVTWDGGDNIYMTTSGGAFVISDSTGEFIGSTSGELGVLTRVVTCGIPDAQKFYVRWLNANAGWDYQMFQIHVREGDYTTSQSVFEGYFNDVSNPVNYLDVYDGESERRVSVGTARLEAYQYDILKYIHHSPIIERYDKANDRWLRIRLRNGSNEWDKTTNYGEAQFTFVLEPWQKQFPG